MTWRAPIRLAVAVVLSTVLVGPGAIGGAVALPQSVDRVEPASVELTSAAATDPVKVIISYDDGLSAASARTAIAARDDITVVRPMQFRNAVVAEVPAGQLDAIAAQPGVARVDLNLPVRAANQSSAEGARVPQARATYGVDGDGDGNPSVYTSNDAVVAVLDTGLDITHPALDGGKVIAWHNSIQAVGYDDPELTPCPLQSSGPHEDDPQGHGTHVSGTIAGTGEGNLAAQGMAPGAAIVGVKVLDCHGGGDVSTLVDGIDWVINNRDTYGIAVINMSIEGSSCDQGLGLASQAVNNAFTAGILVVVAAGNFGPAPCSVSFPGTARDALTVGAAFDPGTGGWSMANFSGRGPTADGRIKPEIVAGGINVLSTRNGGGFQSISGTSMATPVVAGVALLMHDLSPAYSGAQLKSAILSTAIAIGSDNVPNNTWGYGAVDALAALREVDNTPSPASVFLEFAYGTPSDVVVIGDWNADGVDTPGVRRGKVYYLRNSNSGGPADVVIGYGKPGDEIFVGDWNGDGIDTLAVRRGNVFYVRNSTTSGPADVVFGYGRAGDEVLVGDWNGDGIDTFAVRRGNIIYTRDDFVSGPATNVFGYGKATDRLVVGDWNGNGFDTFAVRRVNVFFVKNSNTAGPADYAASLGQADDIPIAGDWDGDGADEFGVRDGAIMRLAN